MATTYQLDDYVPSGSSLKGTILATYDALVEAFGEPNMLNAEPSGDDKVHNEWGIEFEDGDDYVYATIYDWKELSPTDSHYGEYRWHIGGRDHRGIELIYEALGR